MSFACTGIGSFLSVYQCKRKRSFISWGDMTIARATGRFTIDVPANTLRQANTSFPLDPGEIVTIKASYSPFSANVDFGLIAPNGRFYYVP